jgi:3-hydroxyisobutyrate dehydrogenase
MKYLIHFNRALINSSTIVTMLPSSPQVKEVYGKHIIPGLSTLAPDAARDTLCIDSTTLDVDVARAVALEVGSKGARMVDAPVSGGTIPLVCPVLKHAC